MGLAFLAAPYWEIVYWIEVEMAEQHIAVLYNLTDFHNYGTLKKEIIRDQLVVDIRDSYLSELF